MSKRLRKGTDTSVVHPGVDSSGLCNRLVGNVNQILGLGDIGFATDGPQALVLQLTNVLALTRTSTD